MCPVRVQCVRASILVTALTDSRYVRRAEAVFVKTSFVEVDGPVHLADFGGTGSPIVLVHGLGASYTSWLLVGHELARTHRVIAVDLVGFGRTPLAGRQPTIDGHVTLLSRLLAQHVREPAILIGNSMGGLVSLLAAHRYPAGVAKLVLVGPALPRRLDAPLDPVVATMFGAYMLPLIGEMFLRRRMARVGPEKVLRATMELCGIDPDSLPRAAWQESLTLANERRCYPWSDTAFLSSARSLMRVNAGAKVRRVIRSLDTPALLVQGSQDRLVPAAATRAIAALRPDWTLELLEGVGHVPQVQAPERWLEVVGGWLGSGRSA